MKKIAVLSFVLIFAALLCIPAFADAQLELVESSLIIYDDDDDGYFFARVANTGDAAGYFDSGVLEILDADGNAFITKNWIGSSPSGIYLEPGESTFVRYSIWEKSLLETRPSGFNYAPTVGKYGTKYSQIPCAAEFYFNPDDKYDNSVFITFTNNTDGLMHGFEIVSALYDANDNLIYVRNSAPDAIAIHPGSSVTISHYIDSSLCEYLINHNMVPTRVEAYVYLEND